MNKLRKNFLMRLLHKLHWSTMNPNEPPVIHTENERRFHHKIIYHKKFNLKNDWLVHVKKLKKVVSVQVI